MKTKNNHLSNHNNHYPHHKGQSRNILGFTLVELIVVITIFVILGTIAFINLGGFSGNARDSSRTSDLTNISKSLDIYMVRNGSYPTPSIPAGASVLTTVSYSGNIIFSQGTIGDSVINAIGSAGAKMSKKPTDPLNTSQEYTYSIAAASKEYQIMINWEGDAVARAHHLENNPFLDTVWAATGNPTITYLKGNYNGVIARTGTSPTYFLALPSILTSATGTLTNTGITNKLFVQGNTNSGGIIYDTSTGAFLVYSGTLPNSNSTNLALATGIANAYSGTTLAGSSAIKPFVDALTSGNTGALANLGGGLVISAGGGFGSTTTTNATCGSSNGGTGSTTPTTNLCNVGTLSGSVLGNGPWNWMCNSTNGGSSASCATESYLYTFTNFTFTNCGTTGQTGPALSTCRSSYGVGVPWTQDTTNNYLNMSTNGIQLWIVPSTGTYAIDVGGAQGGNGGSYNNGPGAKMRGDIVLTKGTVLKILVGQQGAGTYGGGGGGSFVTTNTNTPLVIAGGGVSTSPWTSTPYPGLSGTSGGNGSNGSGGSGGSGGGASTGSPGGGGLTGNGATSSCAGTPPQSFTNGGVGGVISCNGQYGGFGGGSATDACCQGQSGPGGGYSGGGASSGGSTYGGGGGSYNSGANPVNTAGANAGPGYVTITKL